MRILQIHNYYQTFGGECHVVDSERNLLEKHGHVVHQFSKHSKDIHTYPIYKKIKSYLDIPSNKTTLTELNKCIQEFKPDVAHVHNVFPLISTSAYSALKSKNVPVVQTIHNFRFLCPNGIFFTHGHICEECQKYSWYKSILNKCMRNNYLTSFLYASAISRAWKNDIIPGGIDQFIALTDFTKQKLIRAGIPENRISICGNYVQKIADKICEKENYILYFGRLSQEKGIFTLLDAMRSLPDIQLKVAGSGPQEAQIIAKIQKNKLNNVELIGFIQGQKKLDLISKATGTIVPSQCYDNFPTSVIESMSLGTTVIASKIGGLPHMIKNGVTGILFEPGNPDSLATSIQKLVSDPATINIMSQQALEVAHRQFSTDKHFTQLMDIYEKSIKYK